MGIMYATREQVSNSLEIAERAYAGHLIDSKIQAASRSAEGFLHRRFYPEVRTILRDWPNYSLSPSWELELDDQELVEVEQVLSGGTDITANVELRRRDDLAEPPYDIMQIDLSSNAAFSAGSAGWQQSLSIRGLFAYNDTATDLAGGALSGGINSSVTTLVINPLAGEFTPGIGSLLLIGTERMIVINRRMSAVSGSTLDGNLEDLQSDVLIPVTDGTLFVADEVILIDGERLKINDVAGDNLIVDRAYDGSVLSTHTTGATIYALRTFTVQRGVLGSTAGNHSDADPVYVHDYPALLNELVIAETVVLLGQNSAGYSATVGSGANVRSTSGRSVSTVQGSQYVAGLSDVRERAWIALGRKSRSGAI